MCSVNRPEIPDGSLGEEDPTVTEPAHHAECCGARVTMAEITGTETHVCQVAGVYKMGGE